VPGAFESRRCRRPARYRGAPKLSLISYLLCSEYTDNLGTFSVLPTDVCAGDRGATFWRARHCAVRKSIRSAG
jgi:hypothetical protein